MTAGSNANDNLSLSQALTASLAIVPPKPGASSLYPNLSGCSHSCRDALGYCLECGASTGEPGAEPKPFGRFPSAKALEWFLAKQAFRPLVDGTFRITPGTKSWRNIRRQCRRNATPHVEALAAMRGTDAGRDPNTGMWNNAPRGDL